ncbi:MAG: hypothetical protein Q7R95_01890 [bacterium]|nr:hypothetical protein [bacterium]
MDQEYKKLAEEFNKKGFHFKKVFREDNLCIYSMAKGEKIISFEAFLTKVNPAYEISGVTIGASENFPSDSQVGVSHTAFSCDSLEKAHERLAQIKQRRFNLDNPEIKVEKPIYDGPKRTRGRKKGPEVIYNIPDNKDFSVKDLAEFNNISYANAFVFIQSSLEKGIIKFERDERRASRGKTTRIFKKI